MAVKFRKSAIKFLEKATSQDKEKIQSELKQLIFCIEEKKMIPFTELNIKKMKGEWENFYRLRIGKIRVIFTVNFDNSELEIYAIGFRGDVYK